MTAIEPLAESGSSIVQFLSSSESIAVMSESVQLRELRALGSGLVDELARLFAELADRRGELLQQV